VTTAFFCGTTRKVHCLPACTTHPACMVTATFHPSVEGERAEGRAEGQGGRGGLWPNTWDRYRWAGNYLTTLIAIPAYSTWLAACNLRLWTPARGGSDNLPHLYGIYYLTQQRAAWQRKRKHAPKT